MNITDVPIWEKYTLTIEEASKYFRIGENKLRKLAEENPAAGWVIMNGNRIQIKRKQFDGLPKVAVNFETMFRGLVKKYNKSHEEALPKVTTPHTLRHTFCTNLANAGMNPKALQYIMGHSNINMTLNYYAHATSDSAMAEMERLIA